MKKAILAINKTTDQEVSFTLEQWENLEKTGHAQNWKVLDASALIKEDAELVVDFEFKTWEQKLQEEGIDYNKRIKDAKKLQAIYEAAMEKKAEEEEPAEEGESENKEEPNAELT